MARQRRAPRFYTDFIPYWGLPLLIIHFFMIGAIYAVQHFITPLIGAGLLTDIFSGLLNPPILVLAFYMACLVYLFTREDEKLHFRLFSLSALSLAVLGTSFHIYLPDMFMPVDFVPRFFVILLGSIFGTFIAIFYRHAFCGAIKPLL